MSWNVARSDSRERGYPVVIWLQTPSNTRYTTCSYQHRWHRYKPTETYGGPSNRDFCPFLKSCAVELVSGCRVSRSIWRAGTGRSPSGAQGLGAVWHGQRICLVLSVGTQKVHYEYSYFPTCQVRVVRFYHSCSGSSSSFSTSSSSSSFSSTTSASTSTSTSALPTLRQSLRHLPRAVGTAGPQPGTFRAQWAPLDLSGQMECQNICQKDCQNICQIDCQNICHIECQNMCKKECHIECQNICQIERQNIYQIKCWQICEIEYQNRCQIEC